MALIASLCAPAGFNSAHENTSQTGSNYLSWTSPTVSDLDADSKADSARLRSSGRYKTIDIKLADLRNRVFRFTTNSPNHGRLVERDIDRDGDVDLIWIDNAQQSDSVVLINDGACDFTEAADNTPYAAELSVLFDTSNPSDQPSLQAASPVVTLVSSPFSDIAPVADHFIFLINESVLCSRAFGFTYRSRFAGSRQTRGPPNLS